MVNQPSPNRQALGRERGGSGGKSNQDPVSKDELENNKGRDTRCNPPASACTHTHVRTHAYRPMYREIKPDPLSKSECSLNMRHVNIGQD